MTILAYVDPGVGVLIWQSAVAAVVGAFFYLKKTRRWIVKTFRRIAGRTPANGVPSHVPVKPPIAKVEADVEAR